MSDEKTISRRTALKVITVGGAATALPVLGSDVLAQHVHKPTPTAPAPGAGTAPRFFNAAEMATIATLVELIIPADEHSPGARAAGVPAFIDLMVSESSSEVKKLWRDGLAAVERISQEKLATAFIDAGTEQQISLLAGLSRNERSPRKVEEHFFIALKGLTVDGYYTSSIGIHQELRYKGNAFLRQFVGCTHREHMS